MPIATETTVDEVSQQFNQLLTLCASAKTTEERKTAADELAGKVSKTVGAQKAFNNYGLVDSIKTTYADKKSAGAKEGALIAISSIAALVGQASLPYLISTLPMSIEGLGDRQKNVARAAKNAFQAVVDAVATTPNAVKAVIPHLLAALATDKKWEGKVAALGAFVSFAKTARTQVDRALPEIIPEVSQCMWDSKPEVQKAATRALTAVCGTVTNPDLHPFIPQLVATIEQPNEVPETVYKLAATTFVTTVEAPSLAIMAPILQRGLAKAKARRKALKIKNGEPLSSDEEDDF